MSGYVIRSFHFSTIRTFVDINRIRVRHSRSGSAVAVNASAEYDSKADTFRLTFDTATVDTQIALIIHEALHASCDARGLRKMRIATSEALGYVAQCVFLRGKQVGTTVSNARLFSDTDIALDLIFEHPWRLAGLALAGTEILRGEAAPLEQAIGSYKKYKKEANLVARWDGIK